MINKFENEYAFLSNFYPSLIAPFGDNITYPTVEHAFQACKTLNLKERESIANQPTPGKAKYLGRHVKLRSDWNEIKYTIMFQCVKEKFKIPELRQKLLATKDEKLIEGNQWHDNTWGDCQCPKCKSIPGKNYLGKILMEVRADDEP